ncbi:DUF294 nucleotidyltransferase-like domain-containing protein [Robiginitalea sp. M366]|uniref:DUF294 nucleotidyltransferase-like domain-containing protein n=1 Tax=Robiginitalea aestuariiviva TaxID=3036903 RepID=UPI00240D72E7|nr:DUF294 nucleotidyltransferase-like domain-containing protein [Robiginitalea aestuariiviva]MDG1572765.1 DUF294 nucleotidyltransferase-like domain-containing protein [Robiginitalea aestuariiviva]
MNNRIAERVADFLGRYPPFSELTEKDLLALAGGVDILYREKHRYIFREEDPAHAFFYVVHRGAVELRRSSSGEIMDICDEGDIFGLRPLMAGESYKLEARTQEESILYAIPIAQFRPLVTTYEEVGNFLIESFASNTRNPYARQHSGTLVGTGFGSEAAIPGSPPALLPLKAPKKLVTCTPDTPVKDVAARMTVKKVGSVLVLEAGLPVGIITDRDLRTQVVSGNHPIDAPARAVMTTPVITYPKGLTVTQAQLGMMKNQIGHLCLTEDGTPGSPAVGILSKHDLLLAMGQNPEVLMRAVGRSTRIKEIRAVRNRITRLLQRYLQHNVPMSLTMKIISELNDACIKQVILLALQKEPPPPVPFAWISLGSQGRGEQLLLTDQDNALVYAAVEAGKQEETQAYFLKLAGRINKGLLKIGYPYCPAEMMASNPDWCLPLDQWKKRITQWMRNTGSEEVLLSSIFFDFNYTYGAERLVRELTDFIFERVESHPIFLQHLARGALQSPSPTGFFRQFLLEQDGAHKDFFDLKHRALLPLTDAARVLTLAHRIPGINNTAARFEKLAEADPANRELFLSCSYATKALLKFRARQGLLHGDSGRFIALEQLSKEEKMKLKRCFKALKGLQELIAVRFQLKSVL